MDNISPNDDLINFIDEPAASPPGPGGGHSARPWKILVVDDDDDVYESTRLALGNAIILDRPLQLLHANSAHAALELLKNMEDVAVILLDVVMETERAGLDIIAKIREQFGLTRTRIILRTGQPGYAPEIDTIQRYDINDYRTKSELTSSKLYAALATALRAYDQICRIDESRRGLESILAASQQLAAESDKIAFCRMVLRQLGEFLRSSPDGLVCNVTSDTPINQLRLLTGVGRYTGSDGRLLCEVADATAIELIEQCAAKGHNIVGNDIIASHLGTDRTQTLVGLLHYTGDSRPDDALLNVFSNNVALNAHIANLIAELRHTAFIDRLTGLPNRSAMLETLEHRFRCNSCTSPQTPPCTLALLDVDQFSAINDLFGHTYGDNLLKAIATRLRERLGSVCQLARIGYDVFSILGREDIVCPDRLQELFAEPFLFDDTEHMVTVSMGLVRIDESGESESDRLKDAWIALKYAKSQGQFQVSWYSSDIGTVTRGHTRLLHALRGAFRADRLYLVYQPQIEFGSNRVVGVEALLRWRGEDGRLISPAEFIPIAESSGLIVAMGEWILRSALNALIEIRQAGHHDIRVAINVSVVQLCHPGFLEMLDDMVAETGIPVEQLELEITESVAIKGAETVETLLHAIRQRGIAIALDDFGTGFSSLSYLDRLPADRIKIDRSFVEALNGGIRGARIAEIVIPLGHTLGMTVLAEGVETEAQAARLVELGCHEAQGFLYARPMPLPDLLEWLTRCSQAAGCFPGK